MKAVGPGAERADLALRAGPGLRTARLARRRAFLFIVCGLALIPNPVILPEESRSWEL